MAELIHIVSTEEKAIKLQQGAVSIISFTHPFTISHGVTDPWDNVATAQLQFRSAPGATPVLDTVSEADDNADWDLDPYGIGTVKLHTADTKDLAIGQLQYDINLTGTDAEWNFSIAGTVDIEGTITRTDDAEYQLVQLRDTLFEQWNDTRENLIDAMLAAHAGSQFLGDAVAGDTSIYVPAAFGVLFSAADKIGIVLDATIDGYKTTHETTIDSIDVDDPYVIHLDDAFPGNVLASEVVASSGNGVYHANVGEEPLT